MRNQTISALLCLTAALTAYAEARGLTVEQWFLQLAERVAPSSSEPMP